MKFVHLYGVALPLHFLAQSAHVDAGQRSNGTAGAMIAGNPLGKDQRHLSSMNLIRMNRKLQVRMIDVARSVGEINVQADGLCSRCERKEHERRNDNQREPQPAGTNAHEVPPGMEYGWTKKAI